MVYVWDALFLMLFAFIGMAADLAINFAKRVDEIKADKNSPFDEYSDGLSVLKFFLKSRVLSVILNSVFVILGIPLLFVIFDSAWVHLPLMAKGLMGVVLGAYGRQLVSDLLGIGVKMVKVKIDNVHGDGK